MTAGPVCADILQRLRGLQLHLQLRTDADIGVVAAPAWIEAADLQHPDSAPLASLLARFAVHGFAANRRAVSASLLLRLGWAGGFPIASYLACERVPRLTDYALHFSTHSLLHAVWIRGAAFHGRSGDPLAGAGDWAGSVPDSGDSVASLLAAPGSAGLGHVGRGQAGLGHAGLGAGPAQTGSAHTALRRCLLESLRDFSEPLVEVYHRWSGFSRHALWSMLVSSWGAQFTSVARQLGDADRGIAEARALFALHPEIARAAPRLYEVHVGDSACTCQRRAACCLYFKSPGRPFCASCPVLPEAERLERNRRWVRAQRTLACA